MLLAPNVACLLHFFKSSCLYFAETQLSLKDTKKKRRWNKWKIFFFYILYFSILVQKHLPCQWQTFLKPESQEYVIFPKKQCLEQISFFWNTQGRLSFTGKQYLRRMTSIWNTSRADVTYLKTMFLTHEIFLQITSLADATYQKQYFRQMSTFSGSSVHSQDKGRFLSSSETQDS